MAPNQLNRRDFLKLATTAAAAAGCSAGCATNKSPWRYLTVNEARTLAAMVDQIIPPDQHPGAAWAGVVNYIDRQLCGPLHHLRKTYRQGIHAVNQTSRTLYQTDFAETNSANQLTLLTHMEQGQAPTEPWQKLSQQDFFALLLDHTMQGFYGDPRHGGNRDATSWKMLGLPYPPICGRLHYDINNL